MDSILNSITNSTEQDLSDETVYNLGAMTLEQESDPPLLDPPLHLHIRICIT